MKKDSIAKLYLVAQIYYIFKKEIKTGSEINEKMLEDFLLKTGKQRVEIDRYKTGESTPQSNTWKKILEPLADIGIFADEVIFLALQREENNVFFSKLQIIFPNIRLKLQKLKNEKIQYIIKEVILTGTKEENINKNSHGNIMLYDGFYLMYRYSYIQKGEIARDLLHINTDQNGETEVKRFYFPGHQYIGSLRLADQHAFVEFNTIRIRDKMDSARSGALMIDRRSEQEQMLYEKDGERVGSFSGILLTSNLDFGLSFYFCAHRVKTTEDQKLAKELIDMELTAHMRLGSENYVSADSDNEYKNVIPCRLSQGHDHFEDFESLLNYYKQRGGGVMCDDQRHILAFSSYTSPSQT